jgi:hypothetical protein
MRRLRPARDIATASKVQMLSSLDVPPLARVILNMMKGPVPLPSCYRSLLRHVRPSCVECSPTCTPDLGSDVRARTG